MDIRAKLLPKQIKFLSCKEREKFFIAGIGSGKTRVACWWGITRSLMRRKVGMTEPTYGMCKKNLMPTFDEIFQEIGFKEGQHYTINKTDLEYSFPNGGKIYLCSGDNPDRLRGLNLHDGLMDEFQEEPNDKLYKVLVGRCRNDSQSQIRMTGTPKPVKWVREKISEDENKLIRQTTIENFFLPPEYIQSLKDSYGEDSPWYRQEVLGELVDFSTGLIEAQKIEVLSPRMPYLPKVVRAWDFAHSDKKSSDYTASCLMSTDGKRFIIHDVTHFKGQYSAIRERVIQTMMTDVVGTTQYIEDTIGGKVVRSDLSMDRRLHKTPIMAVSAVNDKITRALPFASRVAQGMVGMCQGSWNRAYIDELNAFSEKCEHDDQVDATAHAYNCLARNDSAQAGKINI